jgi:hypothetical protein
MGAVWLTSSRRLPMAHTTGPVVKEENSPIGRNGCAGAVEGFLNKEFDES